MIRIEFDADMKDFVKDLEKSVKKATKAASNKGIDAAYREGAKIMERERSMSRKGDSDLSFPTYAYRNKIKMKDVDKKGASIYSKYSALNMLKFVDFPREPEKQKGKPVRKRRKIVVRVKKGSPWINKKRFIANTKKKDGGATHNVYARGENKQGEDVMIRQTVSGVHSTLSQDEHQEAMEQKARKAFDKTFEKTMNKEYDKLIRKHSD